MPVSDVSVIHTLIDDPSELHAHLDERPPCVMLVRLVPSEDDPLNTVLMVHDVHELAGGEHPHDVLLTLEPERVHGTFVVGLVANGSAFHMADVDNPDRETLARVRTQTLVTLRAARQKVLVLAGDPDGELRRQFANIGDEAPQGDMVVAARSVVMAGMLAALGEDLPGGSS